MLRPLVGVVALAAVLAMAVHPVAYWDRTGPLREVGVTVHGAVAQVTLAPDGGEMLVLASPTGHWASVELWPVPGAGGRGWHPPG